MVPSGVPYVGSCSRWRRRDLVEVLGVPGRYRVRLGIVPCLVCLLMFWVAAPRNPPSPASPSSATMPVGFWSCHSPRSSCGPLRPSSVGHWSNCNVASPRGFFSSGWPSAFSAAAAEEPRERTALGSIRDTIVKLLIVGWTRPQLAKMIFGSFKSLSVHVHTPTKHLVAPKEWISQSTGEIVDDCTLQVNFHQVREDTNMGIFGTAFGKVNPKNITVEYCPERHVLVVRYIEVRGRPLDKIFHRTYRRMETLRVSDKCRYTEDTAAWVAACINIKRKCTNADFVYIYLDRITDIDRNWSAVPIMRFETWKKKFTLGKYPPEVQQVLDAPIEVSVDQKRTWHHMNSNTGRAQMLLPLRWKQHAAGTTPNWLLWKHIAFEIFEF
eukprot:GHVT01099778.1.p1 GENE.GHVT01099778.1~~GHVT01099778.1.p1  ORF type:complete len:382 (+),score=26.76 GHVT01099778.1:636-1781(+)